MHVFCAQRVGLGLVLCLLLVPAVVSAEEQDEARLELGKEVFVEVAQPPCGVCHTLADAEAEGTIAPSLDDLQPTREQVQAAVRQGPGIMPSFGDSLSDDEIEAVSAYVASVAGKP
ncbi:MAG TPA: cytochrome c [Hyphomicrobiales bacterium]|nr:cytochrome c [Hyphomicrobiales bacterium]